MCPYVLEVAKDYQVIAIEKYGITNYISNISQEQPVTTFEMAKDSMIQQRSLFLLHSISIVPKVHL